MNDNYAPWKLTIYLNWTELFANTDWLCVNEYVIRMRWQNFDFPQHVVALQRFRIIAHRAGNKLRKVRISTPYCHNVRCVLKKLFLHCVWWKHVFWQWLTFTRSVGTLKSTRAPSDLLKNGIKTPPCLFSRETIRRIIGSLREGGLKTWKTCWIHCTVLKKT